MKAQREYRGNWASGFEYVPVREAEKLEAEIEELKESTRLVRQIIDGQNDVIAKNWKDIRKLKISEEAYRIEAWGLDRDIRRLQERYSLIRLTLAETRYTLHKDFLPSAVAERMIEQIDKVLK